MNQSGLQRHPAESGGYWWCYATPEWDRCVGPGWWNRILTIPLTDRFHAKQGRSIGRWTLNPLDRRADSPGAQDLRQPLVVYLKRHYECPRRDQWNARFFPGRAWSPGLQEWEHLRWVAQQGIPVPRVVAAGEYRGGPLGLQSFIALEELAEMLPLHEAIPLAAESLPSDQFHRWKETLWREVARLAWELHGRGAFHQDLYLCHYYLSREDTRSCSDTLHGRVVMIDFHRLKRSQWRAAWYQAKDLGQLLFSLEGVAGLKLPEDAQNLLDAYEQAAGGRFGPSWPLVRRLAWQRAANNQATQQRRLLEARG